MDDSGLKELHKHLLVMMDEIHQICIDNNIHYSLMGGTLIGALRHKGFIPWDDDLDIGMMWDDYQKFISVVKEMNHEWLEFEIPNENNTVIWSFMKAYDSRTTFVDVLSGTAKGVFVDIFPVTYSGNSFFSSRFHFYYHHILKALAVRKYPNFKGKSKVADTIITNIAKICPARFLINSINRHYNRLNRKFKRFVSDFDGDTRGIVPANYFDNYRLYDYERRQYMGIFKADEYLTQVWGDYMQLPPENKRVPHHIDYVNYTLPYHQYKKL